MQSIHNLLIPLMGKTSDQHEPNSILDLLAPLKYELQFIFWLMILISLFGLKKWARF